MDHSRRRVMTAGLGAGMTAAAATAAVAGRTNYTSTRSTNGLWADLKPNSQTDQSKRLQHLIDSHAAAGQPVYLPPGNFRVSNIVLRPDTKLIGAAGLTKLIYTGGSKFVSAEKSTGISLEGIVFDGQSLGLDARRTSALLMLEQCLDLHIDSCRIQNSLLNGLVVEGCAGTIRNNLIKDLRRTALFARDSSGLEISQNEIHDCGDNGIQVWRTAAGSDATLVNANRISRIAAKSGGSGQYGNGVNVFRAGNVLVTNNHISHCAYSAVRGNAASNLQIVANSCTNIGEVALYAEFEFEGAVIANNVVANAASGISVTNFKQGGRMATITSNLIRDLKRRDFEPVDKRGVGISAEADSVISNNIIENAPSAGIALGWGAYRRDLLASQNVIRRARVGILVNADPNAGPTLITNNLIAGSKHGAIRQARLDQPFGPDLAAGDSARDGVTISQNVATPA